MSVKELVDALAEYQQVILAVLAVLPVAAWGLGFAHGRRTETVGRCRYGYSVIVYATAIPGMLSAVITGYTLFFIRANLLEVDAVVYFLPIVSMVATLVLVRKNVDFAAIPGFGRLSGLMILIAISFVVALAVAKTRLWILFGGSIFMLFALAGFAFLLLKWGTFMLFRRGDEPERPLPSFPDELRR